MPEERRAPVIPEANLEAEPLFLASQAIADSYALSTVKQTFWNYEQFRAQNHDHRWNAHDALYTGWMPTRMWEGTTTPRSSLGFPITFSQIETAYPAIYQALFNAKTWFQVSPEPGAEAQEARAIEAHLRYCIEHPRADYTGSTETELELAMKQMLQNGNGGIEVLWDAEAQHPRIEWVDIRDFYIDPACATPSVDAARSLIRRKLFTIDQLEELRDDPRMRIPAKEVLVNMARTGQSVSADRTKQNAEAFRGVQYNPEQHEGSPVPSERKIEVLIYYSNHRIIWVLNREAVAYNERNPYGFVPFCFAPCFPIPGRFYAMSYADVVENPQRYIEALYNAHLDELALALRPPRVMNRNGILTPSQQRWSPGAIQTVNDTKDVAVLAPQGATTGIMQDVSYLEVMVERLTGASSLLGGTARPGNANRTKGGMDLQAHGSNSRLWPLVKHMEDYLIVPMLYKMYKLVQVHTHPGQALPALGPEDQHIQVGAYNFRSGCRFTIDASSKMLTQEKLAQIVPFLGQYLLAGPFMQGLSGVGKTIDFDVFAQMIQDATGTGDKYRLIRPMNEQEQKAHSTPPPQVMMQQQQAQAEQNTRKEIVQMKGQQELQKVQLMKAPDPGQAAADQQQAQMDMQKTMVQLAAERQKGQMAQQLGMQKLLFGQKEHEQKLTHQHQDAQMKVFTDAAMGRQQLHQQAQEHRQNMAVSGAQAQQKMAVDQVQGQQKVEQSKQMTDHKMALDKQKMALQERAMRTKAANKPAKS